MSGGGWADQQGAFVSILPILSGADREEIVKIAVLIKAGYFGEMALKFKKFQ
jgi:hypothetical protein